MVLQKLKVEHEHNPSNPALAHHHPTLKRSLFTVGLFCRYFDFDAHDTGPSSQVNNFIIYITLPSCNGDFKSKNRTRFL